MTMDRFGLGLLALAMTLAACTVEGTDIETTFSDPTANPSGNPPPPGDSGSEGTAGSSGSGEADTGPAATTTETTAADTQSDSTGAPPVDEQPEDGMYSECAGPAQCIGLNTCVLVNATGFCSNTGCTDPTTQCDPNPGAASTAPPTCVDNGSGQSVCALSCAGGQTCPGGMDCVALGASMVCA